MPKLNNILAKALHEVSNVMSGRNSDLDGNIRSLYNELYQCKQNLLDICYSRDYHVSFNHPSDDFDEPEDWYERNEHGDFDSF